MGEANHAPSKRATTAAPPTTAIHFERDDDASFRPIHVVNRVIAHVDISVQASGIIRARHRVLLVQHPATRRGHRVPDFVSPVWLSRAPAKRQVVGDGSVIKVGLSVEVVRMAVPPTTSPTWGSISATAR